MATLTCTNRGCMKTTSDSLFDQTINEIICSECGKTITGISDFTKRSMIGLGKVQKKFSKVAFVVNCQKCQKTAQPKIKDDSFICFFCSEPLNLTKPFANAFKEYLKTKVNE